MQQNSLEIMECHIEYNLGLVNIMDCKFTHKPVFTGN